MAGLDADLVRARVRVAGRVQGVFFRQETSHLARAAKVNGWIRNLPEGLVEAVFEGSPRAVQDLIEWCHRGPCNARVDSVNVEWEEPRGEGAFSIR